MEKDEKLVLLVNIALAKTFDDDVAGILEEWRKQWRNRRRRAHDTRYTEKDLEKRRAKQKEWREKNREYLLQKKREYRAKKRAESPPKPPRVVKTEEERIEAKRESNKRFYDKHCKAERAALKAAQAALGMKVIPSPPKPKPQRAPMPPKPQPEPPRPSVLQARLSAKHF